MIDDVYRLEALMQLELDETLDAVTRRLTSIWVNALTDIERELEPAILGLVNDRGHALTQARVENALSVVRARIDDLVAEGVSIIISEYPTVTSLGANTEYLMLSTQNNLINWDRVSPAQVDAILELATRNSLVVANTIPSQVEQTVRAKLVAGIILGDNPSLVAEQILATVGATINNALARLVNIARTEMLDALRNAQHQVDLNNQEYLTGWVWYAHLDNRTCPSCIAMHGTEHPISEPGPLDHHQGRCARIPKSKTWVEQGFKNVPETQPETTDALAWFDTLNVDEQKKILGVKGWETWQNGEYPPSQWSVRRENPDWRPAYFTRKPGEKID